MSNVCMPPPSDDRPWGAPPPPPTPLPAVPRFPRKVLPPGTRAESYLADNQPLAGIPCKRISTEDDLRRWLGSEAFVRLMGFVQALNDAVVNVKNSDPVDVSETVANLVELLKVMSSWINEIPPLPGAQRFGNKAFRSWVKRLEENSNALVRSAIPSRYHAAVPELTAYLNGGFGNATRIDYGSGHELSFVSFLCCLDYLGAFESAPLPPPPPLPGSPPLTPPLIDHRALVTRVFVEYLNLVRQLQRVYVLEPAGSHGVWGLDDHQFLPYLWGCAQLRDHPRLRPKSILQKDIVSHLANDYLYFGCINYIHEVKSGPFHEHSPMLYDISSVENWGKVNSGMMKMYVAEVLKKLPIIQHQLFGLLLPFRPAEEATERSTQRITNADVEVPEAE